MYIAKIYITYTYILYNIYKYIVSKRLQQRSALSKSMYVVKRALCFQATELTLLNEWA